MGPAGTASLASGAELVEQRSGIERVEADALGDLFARGPGPLEEELAEELARCSVAPPLDPHSLDEVTAELGRADPGTQVVRRVKTRVHVGEVGARAVVDPGGGSQPLLVAVRGPADLVEPR